MKIRYVVLLSTSNIFLNLTCSGCTCVEQGQDRKLKIAEVSEQIETQNPCKFEQYWMKNKVAKNSQKLRSCMTVRELMGKG